MGLFSKLRSGQSKAPSAPAQTNANAHNIQIARAVLAAPILTCYADGEVAWEETQTLVERSLLVPEVQAIGFDAALELVKQVTLDLHQRGGATVLAEAVSVLPMVLREMSLAISMQVAASDGHIDENEVNTLSGIAQRMGISVEKFRELTQLMVKGRSAA